MKLFKSLPARLLLALAAGIALGLVFPENVMVVVVTLNYILGQLITFCVPLIIIGFIAPSITKLGNSATRMLAVAVGLAYLSSILAALLSMGSGYAMIPHLHIAGDNDISPIPDNSQRRNIHRQHHHRHGHNHNI